jgi:hypothetical protein
VQLTGTVQKSAYAFGFGVASLDGPLNNDYLYQPGAAFDQSAIIPGANPAVHDLGVYKDDSLAVSRTALGKLRYELSPTSAITFTSLVSSYWADKTGNGDGDFTPYALALAQGQANLKGYALDAFPNLAPCPAGTFVGTNANGQPNGYGPPAKGSAPGTLGAPDGGLTCQTPQQYAAFNTGYAGAATMAELQFRRLPPGLPIDAEKSARACRPLHGPLPQYREPSICLAVHHRARRLEPGVVLGHDGQ